MDTSSPKNLFVTLRNSTANKSAPVTPLANPLPSAFAAKNAFPPPPVRRVASTASTSHESAAPIPLAQQRPAVQEPEAEEAQEWAVAIYAYTSSVGGAGIWFEYKLMGFVGRWRSSIGGRAAGTGYG